MHPVILESLEDYLAGVLAPAEKQRLDAHLETCDRCRQELKGMQEISTLFASLVPGEAVEPAPGFAARVMQQVGQRSSTSIWSLFTLDLAFGRRVVFVSLLTLAILGSYLVTRETEYAAGPPSPEAIMALDQSVPEPGQSADRDRMLVTLTSYEP
jgi:anti-sigma factor RsiW